MGPFCSSCSNNCSDTVTGAKKRERSKIIPPTLRLVGPHGKHSFMLLALVRRQLQVWEVCQGFPCLGRRSTGGQRRTPPLSSAARLETRIICTRPLRTVSSQTGGFRAAGPQMLPSPCVQTSKPQIPSALDCRPHPSRCKCCTVKEK